MRGFPFSATILNQIFLAFGSQWRELCIQCRMRDGVEYDFFRSRLIFWLVSAVSLTRNSP